VKFSSPFSRDVGKISMEELEDWEEVEPRRRGIRRRGKRGEDAETEGLKLQG